MMANDIEVIRTELDAQGLPADDAVRAVLLDAKRRLEEALRDGEQGDARDQNPSE